jgi:20S proteasome alpha/beta subunit
VAWEDASACELLLRLARSAYGSTKRYKSVERVCKVNDHTLLAASGEISDFQYLQVRDCVNAW